MLILTRKAGQSIMIGDDIEIMLVSYKKGHARIGITAPKNLEVHREEVYEKIKQQEKNEK